MSEELDDVFLHVDLFLRRRFPGEQLDEIVIKFRSGKTRTFSAYDVAPDPARLGRRHSPDFRTVNWYGRVFRFTPKQAVVVQMLWEADEAAAPDVGQAALLEAAESETKRLRDLFRHSEAWGVLIVDGDKPGTFRLGPPPDDTELL